MIISSDPKRGVKLVNEDGTALEPFAIFLQQLTESNNQDNPKNNYRAIVAPVITNNASEGYTVGSEWIDSVTSKVYRLTTFTGANANWSVLN